MDISACGRPATGGLTYPGDLSTTRQALDPNYEDSDQLAVKAREEIERQTQETRREEQLAAMYAAAVKSLDAEDYQKALQQWAEVQELDPKYPDRKKVQKTAKKKLKEIAEPKESRRKLSKSVIAMIGLVGVIIIIVFVAWLAQNLNDGNFSGLALIASKTPTKTPRPSATPTRRPTSTSVWSA